MIFRDYFTILVAVGILVECIIIMIRNNKVDEELKSK